MKKSRDLWWHDIVADAPHTHRAAFDSETPLFVLYTSGSTGNRRVLHTSGGYLGDYDDVEIRVDLKESDTYWCTADIGWITGHSYVVMES